MIVCKCDLCGKISDEWVVVTVDPPAYASPVEEKKLKPYRTKRTICLRCCSTLFAKE